MNRNRMMVGLAVAVLLAFVLSAYIYHAFKAEQVRAAASPVVRMTNIVVAAENLKIGERLDANKVKTIQWPSSAKPDGMFSDIADVANRAVITNIQENEPILAGNLAPTEAGAGLSATIPEGMRAVSVAVNDVVAVAGFAQPGTSVDVMVTGQSQGGNNEQVTRTILEDVRVLAANQRTEQDRQGQAQTVTVITLLVTPEDADKLAMANTMGRVQLALRNAIDENKTAPPPLYQASLLGAPPPAAPAPTATHAKAKPAAPAAPPAYSVEVIRASKREVSEFPNK